MRKTVTMLALVGLFLFGLHPAGAGWDEGVAAFKAKNYDAAIKEFLTVVEQQPEEASGHQMLGQSYIRLKQYQKAVPALRKALELKEDTGVRLALGQALFQLRSYRDVIQVLDKLNAASLPKQHQAVLYQMRSVSYQKSGQESRALGDLQKAVQLSPDNAAVQFNYGTALMANGDTREALGPLGKAAQLDRKDPAKQKAYVKALIRSGRESRGPAKDEAYRKALAPAQSLASTEPSFDNLLLLSEVQLGAKSYDAAIASLDKALAKNSGNWLPYYYKGQALTAKAQYDLAEPPLKIALERTGNQRDQTRVWGQLGFVYERQKNYSEAKEAYQKAGNTVGFNRVSENEAIAQENKNIEEHNRMVQELEKEAKELEKELQSLPGGSSTPPRP